MREYIIDDSSRLPNEEHYINKDYSIRVGMIREHVFLSNSGETRYIVEVWKNNKLYPMTCMRTSRFGGLYNYEEFNFRGFNVGEDAASLGNFKFSPGDMVIVVAADGESREGFILGSVKHYGRDEVLSATGDIAYASEFNGLQTLINKYGEYRVTFKGTPTNIKELETAPNGSEYPLPEYNNEVGFSYYEFNKNGSYLVTDNTEKDPQSIFIDKEKGQVVITSGKTTLTIDKAKESLSVVNKKTTIDSKDEFNLNTKKTTIKSSELVSVDAADIKTKGKLAQTGNVEIEGNTKQNGNIKISGTLSSEGETKLAGGANPLVYDIILTIGTGNLAAPVISNHILLKTVLTKAT